MSTNFFWTGCHGNGPNFLKNIFFPKNYNVICHWKDNFMLINICNRTLVQKCAVSELIANAWKQLWTWMELHSQTTKLFFQNFSKIGILPRKSKQFSKYSQCSFSILPEQNQFNLSQLIYPLKRTKIYQSVFFSST